MEEEFSVDDFLKMMHSRSKNELQRAAEKLVKTLDKEKQGALPKEQFRAFLLELNSKMVDRFGFDPNGGRQEGLEQFIDKQLG